MIRSLRVTPPVGAYYGNGMTMYASRNDLVADGYGVKWALFDVQGWLDGMDAKPAVFERPFQIGANLDAFSYGPRVMEIHGGFIAPDRPAGVDATRRLLSCFNIFDGNYGIGLQRLYVDEYSLSRGGFGVYSDVRCSGRPEIKPQQLGVAYEFSIPVIAPDPRKLSQLQTHISLPNAPSGPLAATSIGDTPTWAEMIITGPVTNPKVTHDVTGWYMQFIGTLAAGQSVGFNTRDHTVGGSLGRAQLVTLSQWFPVMPGANNYTLTGTGMTSATQLDLYFLDAYQ